MVTNNQETNQVQKVEVSRTQSGQGMVLQQDRGQVSMLPVLKLNLTGISSLTVRSGGKLTREEQSEAHPIPHIRISLYEGSVEVNGKRLNIPVGLGRMKGKEFKRFADIDIGNALYVRRDGGMQRVRDNETIELIHDAIFTHRRERPVVKSVPRYSGS